MSARDSRRYLTALRAMLCPPAEKQYQATLHINAPIAIDSLSQQELRDYYRSYLIRILNVLFLCGEHSRCYDYAYKHFSRQYAAQVCAAFAAQRRCLDTHFMLTTTDDTAQDSLTIDGYLLYREQVNVSATRVNDGDSSKKTSPCALPVPLIDRSGITTVLKIKPFQTIELLMRVNMVSVAEVNCLSSIQFLSQWCQDGSPSIFFTCTFAPSQNGEQARQPNSKDERRQRLCVMEPDFKLARWTRYDGKTMKVFADPRLELVDGLVYEFLCYNELELYLLEARADKVLPDDEIKINSILWRRHSSDAFFVSSPC